MIEILENTLHCGILCFVLYLFKESSHIKTHEQFAKENKGTAKSEIDVFLNASRHVPWVIGGANVPEPCMSHWTHKDNSSVINAMCVGPFISHCKDLTLSDQR